jgi:hypothetical protein
VVQLTGLDHGTVCWLRQLGTDTNDGVGTNAEGVDAEVA